MARYGETVGFSFHGSLLLNNMAVVQVITSLSCKDPLLMHLLRLLYFYMALHGIHLRAEHIPEYTIHLLMQCPVILCRCSSNSYHRPRTHQPQSQRISRILSSVAVAHLEGIAQGLITDSLAPHRRGHMQQRRHGSSGFTVH